MILIMLSNKENTCGAEYFLKVIFVGCQDFIQDLFRRNKDEK